MMVSDAVTYSELFSLALAMLGGMIFVLAGLLAFVWKSYTVRQDLLEEELSMLQHQLQELRGASVTYADVKELLDDRFSGLKEGHTRIENSLNKLESAVSTSTTKIALLEDREKRNDLRQARLGGE